MNIKGVQIFGLWKSITLFCLSLFLFSCDEEQEEVIKDYFSPVIEANLPQEIELGQSVNIIVKHTGYDGCGRYSRTETSEKNKDVEVAFYAKSVPPGGNCTQALISIETPFKFTPSITGIYTFRFRQIDGYLTKTLIVK